MGVVRNPLPAYEIRSQRTKPGFRASKTLVAAETGFARRNGISRLENLVDALEKWVFYDPIIYFLARAEN